MCDTGHYVDGWEAINSVHNGLTSLKISCSSPAEKAAGLGKSRTWKDTEKTGNVNGELSNSRYLHGTKYICGVEVTDRGLKGEQVGIEGSVVKFCESNLSNVMTAKFVGIALARGAYGNIGDEISFSNLYAEASKSGRQQLIVRRECSSCEGDYKDIFYKRLRNPWKINPYDVFQKTWSSGHNKRGEDFELYSSLDDALSDRNAWKYCNYDN